MHGDADLRALVSLSEGQPKPIGGVYYGASAMVCTLCSLSQQVGLALGARAGERRLRDVTEHAGFGQLRGTAQTPLNLVFEARA